MAESELEGKKQKSPTKNRMHVNRSASELGMRRRIFQAKSPSFNDGSASEWRRILIAHRASRMLIIVALFRTAQD